MPPVYMRLDMAAFVSAGLLFYFGITSKTEKKLNKELKKYKKGEMILVRRLVDRSLELKVFSVFFLTTIYVLFSVVMPIYNLTSKF